MAKLADALKEAAGARGSQALWGSLDIRPLFWPIEMGRSWLSPTPSTSGLLSSDHLIYPTSRKRTAWRCLPTKLLGCRLHGRGSCRGFAAAARTYKLNPRAHELSRAQQPGPNLPSAQATPAETACKVLPPSSTLHDAPLNSKPRTLNPEPSTPKQIEL